MSRITFQTHSSISGDAARLVRRRHLLLLLAFIWLVSLIGLGILNWRENQATELENLEMRALKLSDSLEAHLSQFRSLPKMVAHIAQVKRVLYLPSETQMARSNASLEVLNEELGTNVIYVLDADGKTVATSNYRQADSFLGNNYNFRPYYQQAIAGEPSSYHAFGIASGKLGYYFSSPVYNPGDTEILGVVVIKINLDFVDSLLSLPDHSYLISDANGIIFLTSERDWLYRTLPDVNDETRNRIANSRQYGDRQPGKALYTRSSDITREVCHDDHSQCREFLHIATPLPRDHWQVHIMLPLQSLIRNSVYFLTLYSAIYWLLIYSFLFYRGQTRYRRYLADEKDRLESRVNFLTSDLRKMNQELMASVNHYRSAKEALEKTQGELIQAEKMALLGELSVGLHHELNQPILAIKAYAENGRLFLQREQPEPAIRNLGEINKISDTMSAIISQFKVFSRKEVKTEPTHLEAIVEGALVIMKHKLHGQRITLNKDWPEPQSPRINAGIVQLQQVVVNLIANAIQAMENIENPSIDIRISNSETHAILEVADNGPGLGNTNAEEIFTPFFTTKPQGLGLGLSLSKRIVELHNGKIFARTRENSGTIFQLEFPISNVPTK